MIAELHAVADTTLVSTYTDPLIAAMQGLHMRDMLGYDDGADEDVLMTLTLHVWLRTVPTMITNWGHPSMYRKPFMPSLLSSMTFSVTP